jgi:hypothetical protein
MAVASLSEIMDALADQIRSVLVNVTDVDIQVEPRLIVSPSPPTIDIFPGDIPREPNTAGFDDLAGAYVLTVRARVATGDNEAGQDLLIAFMDDLNDLSVAQAIMDEPTLNGNAGDTYVREPSGFRVYPTPSGDGQLIGCQWDAVIFRGES